MGVDIRVDGVAEWNASDISVSEDATPLDPADTFGGVGAISFTVPASAASKSMMNAVVDIDDSARGVTTGVVKALSGGRHQVNVEALGRLSALVCDRTALPHVGTIESLLEYYFGLCDITAGIVIDETVGAAGITALGWYGSVWEHVKHLGAAYGFEVAQVGDDIVARPPRQVTAGRVQESEFSWALDESRLSQTVEAWYYPVAEITDALVVGNELSPVSNVGAGDVVVFDVGLSASLSAVEQPVCVDSVVFEDADASVYSVVDQNDQPIAAEWWNRQGGRVFVEISDDTRSLRVTVIGPQDKLGAPFRLVGFKPNGKEFSTLRVVGTGVSFDRRKYALPACVDARAGEIVGAEPDNPFLTSWGHAHLAMLGSLGRYATPSHRIRGSAWRVQSPTAFGGQTFGNVAGSRIFEDHNVYRIRAAQVASTGVTYEAEADCTFGDVDAVNDGFTIEQWDALWAGRPISEFDLRPLTPIPGDVEPPTGGYGSGVYGGPPVYGG